MSLSQSQLRLISSIGIGILVGTSLIVIIPEGIAAITEASLTSHSHGLRRDIHLGGNNIEVRWAPQSGKEPHEVIGMPKDVVDTYEASPEPVIPPEGETLDTPEPIKVINRIEDPPTMTDTDGMDAEPVPTFYVGLSLILGFVLMFLIDRLPRHASENFQPPPTPRHISLSNLGGSALSGDEEEESEGFLGSLTPTPKQSRSLATTTGLVIHAAADGIAMGASASSSDMQLGFIIFIAIMVHKAPAAFGLTSILLKQGLSKRAARGHLIVFSLASPFGAWSTFILVKLLGGGGSPGDDSQWNQWWTGMLLLFSAGTFLYVAMHAMQEGDSVSSHDGGSGSNGYAESPNPSQRKQARPQMRDTLASVAGMLLPLLTQFGHHH
ncbi:Zinc/iron permease [Pseudomassariella vexata]|uniref:Zinc/iron permease n=1 Tax=Pseudomassariella vexata TaxID=1141098 RepID=A0A1Y2EEZ5_9PEZI|nr:Zinc/iron permease [Pseudomassariella vexata]ORY69884.1 Zinc/iron permease [Pseudomassariella vexata]